MELADKASFRDAMAHVGAAVNIITTDGPAGRAGFTASAVCSVTDTPPTLLFESFAYKRGVPAEADFVFDARVLPNPHWDPELRPLTGRDRPVRDYLDAQADVARYVAQLEDLLDTWLPKLGNDTRSYVTIAFGCTGGKHRSVYLAERLARHARAQGWPDVATFHREQD